MAEEKKLFLLDAFALIYRAYYAFIKNPRINSKGLNTSAVFGFTNTLLDVLKNQKPTHIAVVFDHPGQNIREIEYSDYKANREEMPEDIRSALPWIKKTIEAFNIPMLSAEGYEADDVIGTLARKAEKEGFITFMMTPDKDFAQLVTEKTFMFKPPRMGNKFEILGIPEVCEKFEIDRPEQVIDILGLWGDAVDNIPGVPGVGEKTAKKFVKAYGSVEGLYKNTHELKGKIKEKVEANHEQAILSKKLATILLDAPVEFIEEDLIIEEPNKEALISIFTDLEFRNMATRMFGETITVAAPPKTSGTQTSLFDSSNAFANDKPEEKRNLENTKHNYQLVQNESDLHKLSALLAEQKTYCFDTETTGINPQIAELVGLAFCFKKGTGYYIPFGEDYEESKAKLSIFKNSLENESIEKVGHNIKYDLTILKRYGINVKGEIYDTMLAHFLIEPDMRRRKMDVLADTYLNYNPVPIEDLIGEKGKNQGSMRDVELEKQKEYAVEDADITLQLKDYFKKEMVDEGIKKLYKEVEAPLIPVLTDMEYEGVKIDVDSLHQLSEELVQDILKRKEQIFNHAGADFNISSPKQVGEILFEKLKIVDKPKKTKTGQYATNEEVLSKLANDHPIVSDILDYRELVKLKNTYVDTLPTMVNPRTGRIHTSYSQMVAATGRLSSDHPNLQNIPIRTDRGKEIRKAFIPRGDDYILLASDYSQIELRIMAALSEDQGMMEAFINGKDIHSATASRVWGVPLEEVTREMRSKAKVVNFGIIYGISAFGLSQRINIPRKEARELINNYFEKYPGIKEFMDGSVIRAKEKGYVETILGRKRPLRDINSANAIVRGAAERFAINAPIQGSAADMIKVAMINLHHEIEKRKLQSKMILQVHDELVFDVHKNELEEVKSLAEDLMQNAIKMKVPIKVDSGTGSNWLQAH